MYTTLCVLIFYDDRIILIVVTHRLLRAKLQALPASQGQRPAPGHHGTKGTWTALHHHLLPPSPPVTQTTLNFDNHKQKNAYSL